MVDVMLLKFSASHNATISRNITNYNVTLHDKTNHIVLDINLRYRPK